VFEKLLCDHKIKYQDSICGLFKMVLQVDRVGEKGFMETTEL